MGQNLTQRQRQRPQRQSDGKKPERQPKGVCRALGPSNPQLAEHQQREQQATHRPRPPPQLFCPTCLQPVLTRPITTSATTRQQRPSKTLLPHLQWLSQQSPLQPRLSQQPLLQPRRSQKPLLHRFNLDFMTLSRPGQQPLQLATVYSRSLLQRRLSREPLLMKPMSRMIPRLKTAWTRLWPWQARVCRKPEKRSEKQQASPKKRSETPPSLWARGRKRRGKRLVKRRRWRVPAYNAPGMPREIHSVGQRVGRDSPSVEEAEGNNVVTAGTPPLLLSPSQGLDRH